MEIGLARRKSTKEKDATTNTVGLLRAIQQQSYEDATKVNIDQ